MGKPAARLGDLTSHGGTIVSGASNVFFNGKPAANALSTHVCPMVTPGTPPIPHVGMFAVPMGALTVLINGSPAIVMGDMFLCVGPPATVVLGSPNILIGMSGSVSVGSATGEGSSQTDMACALQSGNLSPVKGTETWPVDIQTTALAMQAHHTPQQFELDMKLLDLIAKQRAMEEKKENERVKLTIKDFVEIFEAIEKEQGYEAARHYCSTGINYDRLTEVAKSFIDGRDTNPDNDPNIMPTRFMLLYGADDSKLKIIDKHPDAFDNTQEHNINISNLRKGLRLLGADIFETGPYDDKLWMAHAQYINRFTSYQTKTGSVHIVEEGESLGAIAKKYGLPTWKYLYQINKEKIGKNPDLLIKGTELQIPQCDSTSGDEKIVQKGAAPAYYAHGSRYRYPWVPFSITIVNEKGKVLKKEGREKKLTCELRDSRSGNLLASDTIENGGSLKLLIPDSRKLEITADGYTCDIEMKGY